MTQRARKVRLIANSRTCELLATAYPAAAAEREVEAVALTDRGRDRGRVPIESAGSQQMVFGLPWITP